MKYNITADTATSAFMCAVFWQSTYSAVQWVVVLCLDTNCNVQIFPLAS